MTIYNFFYDESEHSRKINYNTINAQNYYDNFITMIVGWSADNVKILDKYTAFENKYEDRKDRNGEIKSRVFKQTQFKKGFASLNKQNACFLEDFLSIFDEDVHIYFSVGSKVEFIVTQLFRGYKNNILIDMNLMKYSIIKALVLYRPKDIIKCMCESPELFLTQLKQFFQERIELNQNNPVLKRNETRAFEQILMVLEDVSNEIVLDWDYHMPFYGFKKYLHEKDISDYLLTIDKEGEEGEDSKTLKAAKGVGLDYSLEAKSEKCQGLRMADMLAGIISKLMKGLNDSLRYESSDDGINKKLLDSGWFRLNETQLRLYKKLYRMICEWNPAWYKSYAGIYADDLIIFNALLNFMNNFKSVDEIREKLEMQGEYFNYIACKHLEEEFKKRRCKLTIDPVIMFDDELFLNQRNNRYCR